MAGIIETLRKIQGIDAEIAKLKAELDRWPAIVAEKNKDVENARKAVEEKAAEIKATKVEAEGQELKLKSGEADVGKVKGNLLKVKTNREYEAVLKEIEGLKAENSVIEEKIIGLLDRIQSFETEIRELKAEQKRAEGEVAEQQKQARADCSEIEAEIKVLEDRRRESSTGVSSDVLDQYERILLGRSGLAIVPVVDNVCQGCFRSLTAQEINTLLLSEDGLIQCRSCQRILFLENPSQSGYDWEEPEDANPI